MNALLIAATAAGVFATTVSQEVIPLWPGPAPGARGSADADVPTLTVFTPAPTRATGTGVLVFPGGGYDHLAFEKEGTTVGAWLAAQGATAFVVRYRHAPGFAHPIVEQDGMRAVRVVRAQADRFKLRKDRIAVLGFSAGGHLAGSVSVHGGAGNAKSADPVERESARPDAAVLVYPVVSMQAPFTHEGSRRNLLGTAPSVALLRAMSLETQVTAQTPPTFLVSSSEDKSVPVENSLALYTALRAARVPAELHVYERGRHGWGLAPDDPLLAGWTRLAADWLARTLGEPRLAATADADTSTRAIVDVHHTGAAGAKVNGVPTYRTVNAAIEAAPNFPEVPWTIRLKPGRYREKVAIDKPNIRLVGAHRDSVIIIWDDYAGRIAAGGAAIGTRGTWTLRATQPDVQLAHLTVENSFDYDGNAAKPASDSTKVRDTQGLAVAFADKSDRAVLRDVVLLGHQDTFFADAGRTYVTGSRIVGNVDFIFGSGRLVIESSDIVSLDRGSATNNGYIAAPSTDITNYGMLFLKSRLLKGSPSVAPNSVSLGRPWHPGGNPRAVGMAIFVECFMDDHIQTKGWDRMSAGPMTNGERLWFEPEHARFAEYKSTGPGGAPSPTRRRLSDGDATSYTKELFLDGWSPGTP